MVRNIVKIELIIVCDREAMSRNNFKISVRNYRSHYENITGRRIILH